MEVLICEYTPMGLMLKSPHEVYCHVLPGDFSVTVSIHGIIDSVSSLTSIFDGYVGVNVDENYHMGTLRGAHSLLCWQFNVILLWMHPPIITTGDQSISSAHNSDINQSLLDLWCTTEEICDAKWTGNGFLPCRYSYLWQQWWFWYNFISHGLPLQTDPLERLPVQLFPCCLVLRPQASVPFPLAQCKINGNCVSWRLPITGNCPERVIDLLRIRKLTFLSLWGQD